MKVRCDGFSLINLMVYCAASSVLAICVLQVASRLVLSVRTEYQKADTDLARYAGLRLWQKGVHTLSREKEKWLRMNAQECITLNDEQLRGYAIEKKSVYYIAGPQSGQKGKKTRSLLIDQFTDAYFTYVLSEKTPQMVKAVVLHATLPDGTYKEREWWSTPDAVFL